MYPLKASPVNILDNDGNFGYLFIDSPERFRSEEPHLMSEDGWGDFTFTVYPARVPNGTVAVDVVSPVDRFGNRIFLLNNAATAALTLIFDENVEPLFVNVTYSIQAAPLDITDRDLMIKLVLNNIHTTDEKFQRTEASIPPIDITLIPGLNNPTAKSIALSKTTKELFVVDGPVFGGLEFAQHSICCRPCRFERPPPLTTRRLQDIIGVNVDVSAEGQVSILRDFDEELCRHVFTVFENSTDVGNRFVRLTHNVNDPTGVWDLVNDTKINVPDVIVKIYDNDIPQVVLRKTETVDTVEQNEGECPGNVGSVDDGPLCSGNDSETSYRGYEMRLSRRPANDTQVSMAVVPTASDYEVPSRDALRRNTTERLQLLSRSFRIDPDQWNQWHRLPARAFNDDLEEGLDYLYFPSRLQFARAGDAPYNIVRHLSEEPLQNEQLFLHDGEP